MTVERETYAELTHSMMFAFAGGQLSMPQVASVLYACAQQTTTEETTDITMKVREALTDWPEQDKGMLICIEVVKMTFQCVNIHGPCAKGHHTVNMTRVIGSMDWDPDMVSSQHDFSEVLIESMGVIRTDDGELDGKLVNTKRKGSRRDLIEAFQSIFDSVENPIDKEVKDFRAELDALFPSTQTKEGGNDGSTSPAT